MTSVNISLTKEAYGYLKMLKGREKSFSEVILTIKNNEAEKGTGKSLLKFAGILKDINWGKRERRMKEFRKSFNKRMEKTRKDMEEARKK